MRQPVVRLAVVLGLVCSLAVASSLAQTSRRVPPPAATSVAGETWVDAWAVGFLPTTVNGTLRTSRTFENQTFRLNVFVKLGGRLARVRLTNRFTDVPLVIGAAHVAMRTHGAAIDPATDHALTFGGQATVTVPAGEAIWSDPVPLVVTQHADVAISIFVPGPYRPTGFHAVGLKTSYVGTGNLTAAPSFPAGVAPGEGSRPENGPTTDQVFLVSGLQVLAPASTRVIVALGDSITDGAASDVDANGSWPDVLSMRLPRLADGTPVAVINMGIGSNRFVSADRAGPTGTARFEEDVLARPHVTHVIIMEGINDISYEHVTPGTLIDAYKAAIARAHARGIKVCLATLLPIQNSVKDTPENLATQQAVNQWIRAGDGFDGVIDFEKVVQDPQNPLRIRADLTGDYVHPNTRGYRLMGEAIQLKMFEDAGRAQAISPPVVPRPDFGPNVLIVDPSMPSSQVQDKLDAIWTALGATEFGTGRQAVLFMPGTYDVNVRVGYYTQVLGLGASPDQVAITGDLKAGPAKGDGALVTFWRSAEGLSVKPASGALQWAVSQAAPFRRMHVRGDMVLHQNGGYSSGGWMSDTLVEGTVSSGSQQQWMTRNSEFGAWTGAVWNMVFVGVVNAPPPSFPTPPITVIGAVPLVREKPFLFVDAAGRFRVRVPALVANSSGISWRTGATPGRDVPIERFYVARPDRDDAASINAALAKGQHLLVTPGIYRLGGTIRITKPDTLVLGLGFATLVSTGGSPIMTTADVDGVIIAGLFFDAGPDLSPVLLEVGPAGSKARHTKNPASLHDVFFRAGGAAVGRTGVNLRVNAHDTIIDHTWIWRADHGSGVGWTDNTSANGLVVNGDDVTVYGLFVEHHQEFQTLWNGNGGRVYFYQCEIPYDPPDQRGYTSAPGTNGWAAYKVSEKVTSHEAWGLGVYAVFRKPNVLLSRAFEVPRTPSVRFHNLVTVSITQNGEITNVINDVGGATLPRVKKTPKVTDYPAIR